MISLAQLRRYVVAAQGFAARPRNAGVEEVVAAIERLSAVQLDSIPIVERSHRIVLGSRVGVYPEAAIGQLLGEGRIFEYWAHEKSLIPMELYPHFRLDIEAGGRSRWYGLTSSESNHIDEVLETVRERGPVSSRDFERGDETTLWKAANRVLNALWNGGALAIARRDRFERLYDLTERVIPKRYLDRKPTEDESIRELAARAVVGRGALTAAGIVEHWRWKGGVRRVRPHLDALVSDGRLRELAVDDGGAPVYVPAGAELDVSSPKAAVLLSPFDNLLWDKALVERLFGFTPLIEVYKRPHERVFGYYVLPFLLGDQIVGRADLKTDRAEGAVRVLAFHLEQGVRRTRRLTDGFERALQRLGLVAGVPSRARGLRVEQ